eukprot:COSAG05_NODE_20_length_33177_cov_336.302639_21_plen_116_part_00
MFDGCCRGGLAKTQKLIGKLDTVECQHRCSLDRKCNAIEVNGCNSSPLCGGQCYHFYGTGPVDTRELLVKGRGGGVLSAKLSPLFKTMGIPSPPPAEGTGRAGWRPHRVAHGELR